jgi:hypothetical protein
METDAIEDLFVISGWGAHECKARDQLAALLAKIDRLQDRVDDLTAGSVHTCGPDCGRPACVARRERDALTPQWLPAGKLPDAGSKGWWFACRNGSKPSVDDIIWFLGDDFRVLAGKGYRFAKMPEYAGPEDAG